MSDPMLPNGVDRYGKCAKCKRYFNGNRAFDKHQKLRKDGSVLCRDPETLGMFLNEKGYWSFPYTGPWSRDDEDDALVTAHNRENGVETDEVALDPTNAEELSFGAVQGVLL